MGSEVQGSGFRVLGSEFSAAADRGSGQINRKINFVVLFELIFDCGSGFQPR